MKVLLINPPSDSPHPIAPLGLAYMAGMLERNGIDVKLKDMWAEPYCWVGKWYPDLIGISLMSSTYKDGIKTIQMVKNIWSKAKIVIGGTHPSSCPEECLEIPEVDFVITGEGDYAIVKLAHAFKTKTFPKVKQIIKGGIVPDLNELPLPARHLLPMDRYTTHPPYRFYKEYATMITSRGCPYQCTYCTKSVSGQKLRMLSPLHIIKEMESLIKDYGIKQIHFYDDNFTIDKSRIFIMCMMMGIKNMKISWSCVTRPDLIDEPLLTKMKEAGCWLIAYGVESGNQRVLDKAKKGYTIEQVREAFELTRKVGIRTLGYFMANLPGETQLSLNDTIGLSFSLKPDFVSWSVTALYPGSELYQQTLDSELGISSRSPYAHGEIPLYQGDLFPEYISKMVDGAYRMFYFRVGYIVRLLFRMRTWTEFVSYVRAFVQYLRWRKK